MEPNERNTWISEGHIKYYEGILGLIILIDGIIVGNILSEGLTLSGWLTFASLFPLVLLMAHVYRQHHIFNKRVISKWKAISALFFALLFFALGIYFFFCPPSKQEPIHFRVTSTGYLLQMLNGGENATTFFDLLSPGKDSTGADVIWVTRLPVVAYLTIKNARTIPTTVTSLSAEASRGPDGPWTKLCRVDLRTGQLVTMLGAVLKVQLEDLDHVLPEKNIQVGETVAGWSAWGCKLIAECSFPFSHMRITFDENGEKSTVTLPLAGEGNNMTSAAYKPLEPIDLTNEKLEFNKRCN